MTTQPNFTDEENDHLNKAVDYIEAAEHEIKLAYTLIRARIRQGEPTEGLMEMIEARATLRETSDDISVLLARQAGFLNLATKPAPETVTTVEELNALPANSVIEDGDGSIFLKWTNQIWCSSDWVKYGAKEVATYCPAVVIYRPDSQGAA